MMRLILLADEPTGELDTQNARIVVEYLVKVNRELGKTILMVTHDQALLGHLVEFFELKMA